MKSRNDDACLESTDERKARIRRLNDDLRKGRGKGELLVTPGVIDLANGALPDIFALLRDYDAFSNDNDPYGEHDFGAFSYRGASCSGRSTTMIDLYATARMTRRTRLLPHGF